MSIVQSFIFSWQRLVFREKGFSFFGSVAPSRDGGPEKEKRRARSTPKKYRQTHDKRNCVSQKKRKNMRFVRRIGRKENARGLNLVPHPVAPACLGQGVRLQHETPCLRKMIRTVLSHSCRLRFALLWVSLWTWVDNGENGVDRIFLNFLVVACCKSRRNTNICAISRQRRQRR